MKKIKAIEIGKLVISIIICQMAGVIDHPRVLESIKACGVTTFTLHSMGKFRRTSKYLDICYKSLNGATYLAF